MELQNQPTTLSDFHIIGTLGKGTYSTVFKAQRKADNCVYALKQVNIPRLKEKDKQNTLNEARIMASIHHPNIIAYKEAFFQDDTNVLWQFLSSLVMEYADKGDLYQKILQHRRNGVYIQESFIWDLLIQVTRGLKALHDLNIHHRDIKSANVFLTSQGTIKLGDLNVSKFAENGFLSTQTGTPYYASPEI